MLSGPLSPFDPPDPEVHTCFIVRTHRWLLSECVTTAEMLPGSACQWHSCLWALHEYRRQKAPSHQNLVNPLTHNNVAYPRGHPGLRMLLPDPGLVAGLKDFFQRPDSEMFFSVLVQNRYCTLSEKQNTCVLGRKVPSWKEIFPPHSFRDFCSWGQLLFGDCIPKRPGK